MTTADATAVPEEPDDEAAYLQTLGRFIESYAAFEAALVAFATVSAGFDSDMAKIVFAGMNVEQKISFVRRIWRVRPPSPETRVELDDVFAHVNAIQKVRNSMLHFGTFVTADRGRVTSDAARQLVKSEVKEHRISVLSLMEMNLDIMKCGIHLISLAIQPTASFADRVEAGPMSAPSPLERAWFHTVEPDRPQRSRKPKR